MLQPLKKILSYLRGFPRDFYWLVTKEKQKMKWLFMLFSASLFAKRVEVNIELHKRLKLDLVTGRSKPMLISVLEKIRKGILPQT